MRQVKFVRLHKDVNSWRLICEWILRASWVVGQSRGTGLLRRGDQYRNVGDAKPGRNENAFRIRTNPEDVTHAFHVISLESEQTQQEEAARTRGAPSARRLLACHLWCL